MPTIDTEDRKKLFALIKDNSTQIILLATLWVNLVGVSFNMGLFASYGISYLDFAHTADFVLAALKSPTAFFLSVLYIFLGVLLVLIFRKTKYWWKNTTNKFSYYFGKVVFNPLFVFLYSILLVVGSLLAPFALGYDMQKNVREISTTLLEAETKGALFTQSDLSNIHSERLFLGLITPVRMLCEIFEEDRRVTRKYRGLLISEAGDMYLLDTFGHPLMISKSCVKAIEPYGYFMQPKPLFTDEDRVD